MIWNSIGRRKQRRTADSGLLGGGEDEGSVACLLCQLRYLSA